MAVTQWLFAPMLAQKLDVNIKVPFDEYFAYALPATIAYVGGLTLPLWRQRSLDEKTTVIFQNLSIIYKRNQQWGIALIMIGLPFWALQNSVPASLNFIFYLMSQLLMIGICLLMFNDSKTKWFWVAFGILLLISTTFLNGMIGAVLWWMIILGVIYSGKQPVKIPYTFKLAFLLLGLGLLMLLQSAKTEYRKLTWDIRRSDVSSRVSIKMTKDPALFYGLIKEKIFVSKTYFDRQSVIGFAERLNQGYLVSLAMDYVPRRRAFGNGEATLLNSITAFVPRIFWKSKPVIGQREHFKKYTGIKLGSFTSATIGPIGDAYVDFGKFGILFLGLFGWMIGQIYLFWVNKSLKDPSFILWFVVLYFGAIGVSESSVAGFINAVFKYLIFIFIIRFVLHRFFRIKV